MYNINTICNAVLTRSFFVTFIILITFSTLTTVTYAEDCTYVENLNINSSIERFELTGTETEIFETYVDVPGILTFNAMAPLKGSADVKLALFDNSCRPVAAVDGAEVIARYTSEIALWVESPGTYRFGVAVQDPATSLESFDVAVRFIDEMSFCKEVALTAKAVGETEDVPDLAKAVGETEDVPDLFHSCFSKAVGETEDVPDLAKAVGETEDVPDLVKAVGETEDVPDLFQVVLSSLPLPRTSDDHSGSFFFATPLPLGRKIIANVENSWGGDFDTFTFFLGEQKTVKIDGISNIEGQAKLYDRYGQPLTFSTVTTLAAGRYYVRIAGTPGLDEIHYLSVAVLGW